MVEETISLSCSFTALINTPRKELEWANPTTCENDYRTMLTALTNAAVTLSDGDGPPCIFKDALERMFCELEDREEAERNFDNESDGTETPEVIQ